MYPMDISRTIKLIIHTCLNVQADQRILIVGFSDDDFRLASALAAEAHASGAEVGLVFVEPPVRKAEPPPFLAVAMKEVDTIVTLGSVDFGHTEARKEATDRGISFAYIPDLMNQEIVEQNIGSQDLLELKELTIQIAGAVTNARKARVTSPGGTDIEIDIEGRTGLPLYPILDSPGRLGIVPFYFEIACAMVEGRARGIVVADGTIVGLPGLNGVLREPIRWEVAEGRVVDVRGGKEARLLREMLPGLGEKAGWLGELGIGSNAKMRNILVGNRRDNAILGHIHLALGRNKDLGGKLSSPIHADFLIMDARVELDGKPIIDQRRFLGLDSI